MAKKHTASSVIRPMQHGILPPRMPPYKERAYYYQNTQQACTNGAETRINFESAGIANANVTTGANWVFTAPKPGIYDVRVSVTLVGIPNPGADTNVGWLNFYILAGGTPFLIHRGSRLSGKALCNVTQFDTATFLNIDTAGWGIYVTLTQTTGANRNTENAGGSLSTWIHLVRLIDY